MLQELELLEEKPESRYNEAEPHQSKSSANPCEKSSLGG
jgi:hypothetical protein